MSLLRAARGGVIEDLNVDWGVQDPPSKKEETSFDDDFEMISDETVSIKTAVEPPAPAPISLFDTSTQSTAEDLGPKKMIINLAPPPRIQQAPKSDKLPIPLYPGFRCSIFSIIKVSGQTSFSSCVRINGKVMGSPVSLEIPVTPIALEGRAAAHLTDVKVKLLHSLAARVLIQDWEDKEKTEKNRAEIERLGKRYSLASSATSFLAVDDESKKEIEKGEVDYPEPERQVHEVREEERAKRRVVLQSAARPSPPKAHGAIHVSSTAFLSRPSGGAIGSSSGSFTGARRHHSVAAPASPPARRSAPAPMGGLMGSAGRTQDTSRSISTVSSFLATAEDVSFACFDDSPSLERSRQTIDDDDNDKKDLIDRRSYRLSSSTLPASTPVPAPGSAGSSKAQSSRPSGSADGSRGGGFFKKLVSRSSAAPTPALAPAPSPFSAPAPMQTGVSQGERMSADLTQDRPRARSSTSGYAALSGSYYSALPTSASAPVRTPASYGGTLTIESIARAQQFDGGFPVSSDFIHLLTGSPSTPALPGELAVLNGSEQAKQIIWVTVLVLAVLAKKFAKDKDSWEMLAEKSSEFVETSLVSMGVDSGNAVMVTDQLKMAATRNI